MTEPNSQKIVALLKSIETGVPGPVAVVDQSRYVQHNPQTHEGSEGLETLFARLAKTAPRVNAVRAFDDGDYVFAHMEYDFSSPKVCFEVFRFEDGRAVEHWDNIQPRTGPNRSGHDMVQGPVHAQSRDLTEANRALIRRFVSEVLIAARPERLDGWLAPDFREHNPDMGDDLAELRSGLDAPQQGQKPAIDYVTLHRVLAEGDFVLSVSEGRRAGVACAYYDLFRAQGGRIAEHWDTTEAIAPRSEWKNENGKF